MRKRKVEIATSRHQTKWTEKKKKMRVDYPDDLSTMVHGWLATRQVVLAYPGWRRFAASRGRGYGAHREEASRTKVERAWPACAGPLYGATRSARVEQPSPVVLLPDTTRMLSTSERFFPLPPTTIDARSGWTWHTMHTVYLECLERSRLRRREGEGQKGMSSICSLQRSNRNISNISGRRSAWILKIQI